MSKPRILVQLDTDPQPSVFDSIVAIDAEVDQLLRHGGVREDQVRDLVYGAIFTRGIDDLKSTALFVGGSDVAAGEGLLDKIRATFFGPMRVSVMLDSNGANSTAAAAVLSAGRHCPLRGASAVVLAATGPVGSRVVRLLALEGARVQVASRNLARAEAVCHAVSERTPNSDLEPLELRTAQDAAEPLSAAQIVIAAGAPGVELATENAWSKSETLKVAIDLSAVPPVGLAGIDVTDRAAERNDIICYGAIGVGGTKMKIHKAAIRALFTDHDRVLDAEEIYHIGRQLSS